MHKHFEESYPIQVGGAFWPLFFTSRLMVRIIGGTTCFCLTDFDNRQQTILVVPESSSSALPSVEELLNAFPLWPINETKYTDPGHVPASYSEVRTWRNLGCLEVKTKQRLLRILTFEKYVRTSQTSRLNLMFMRFWRAPELQIAKLNSAIGADRLWYQDRSRDRKSVV